MGAQQHRRDRGEVRLVKGPLLRLPANDERDPKVIEIADPKRFVKLVALGMISGSMHVIQHLRGGHLHPPLPGPAPVSDIMTADEVAEFLRLDRKTVYDFAGRGEIPCQRLGKRILFSRAALVSWLGAWSKGSSDGGSG